GNFKAGDALYPQPTGFEGYSSGWDTYWDTYGVQKNFAIVEPGALVQRAYGSGTIAIGTSSSGIVVHKVDATGTEIAQASVSLSGVPLAGAEDASGAVLAIVTVRAAVDVRAVWFDLTHSTAGA